jgi:hypothetical protein
MTGTNSWDCGPVSGVEDDGNAREAGRCLLEEIQPFAGDGRLEGRKAGDVATRVCQVRNETLSDWIGHLHEDDRYGAGGPQQCGQVGTAGGKDQIGAHPRQLRRVSADKLGLGGGPAHVKAKVFPLAPSQSLECLRKCCRIRPVRWLAFRGIHEHTDAPHALALLPARRERPRCRAAERG